MTTTLAPAGLSTRTTYTEAEIHRRVKGCPKLASLQSINAALNRLTRSDASPTSQIAELIQRDPSLSQRLLRLVNSVYFGLSARVNNIEEAVFFLGLRQIREFAIATPVIEELDRFPVFSATPLPWKHLWCHSIATGILTRDLLAASQTACDDDTDYLAGLLHNVGKVVMAYAFPEELAVVLATPMPTPAAVCALERELIGWDHAQIGAYFLELHQLSEELSVSVRYHHAPENAPQLRNYAAAVQVADYFVRYAGIQCGFEQVSPIAADAWTQLGGWKILFDSEDQTRQVQAAMARSAGNLRGLVNGML